MMSTSERSRAVETATRELRKVISGLATAKMSTSPQRGGTRGTSSLPRASLRPEPARRRLFRHKESEQDPASSSDSSFDSDLEDVASALLEQMSRPTSQRSSSSSSEIDLYRESLHRALDEVQRIRVAEESLLTARAASAQDALTAEMAQMRLSFDQQARHLENEALEYVSDQRRSCEQSIAERVQRLGAMLATGSGSVSVSASPAASPATTAARATAGPAATATGEGHYLYKQQSPSSTFRFPSPSSAASPGAAYSPAATRLFARAEAAADGSSMGMVSDTSTDSTRSQRGSSLAEEFTLLDRDQRKRALFLSPQAPPAPSTARGGRASASRRSAGSRPWSTGTARSGSQAAFSFSAGSSWRPCSPVRGAELLGFRSSRGDVGSLHKVQPRALDLLARALAEG